MMWFFYACCRGMYCKLRIPAEHVVYTNCCFCFDIQNNFGTQHALEMLRAPEKYLPVLFRYFTETIDFKFFFSDPYTQFLTENCAKNIGS